MMKVVLHHSLNRYISGTLVFVVTSIGVLPVSTFERPAPETSWGVRLSGS